MKLDVITSEHLQELADLDAVLAGFYEQALAAAKSKARVSERKLRTWMKEQLITSGGTWSTVYRGAIRTAGLHNPSVDSLEERRLIRAEERAGAKWYELTHDRLIEPIQSSNSRYAAQLQRKRRWLALAGLLVLTAAAAATFAVGAVLFVEATSSKSTLEKSMPYWLTRRRRKATSTT